MIPPRGDILGASVCLGVPIVFEFVDVLVKALGWYCFRYFGGTFPVLITYSNSSLVRSFGLIYLGISRLDVEE